MDPAGHGSFDKARALENLQMLGDGRLRRPEMLTQLAGRPRLASGELVQDRPARAIAQRSKRSVYVRPNT